MPVSVRVSPGDLGQHLGVRDDVIVGCHEHVELEDALRSALFTGCVNGPIGQSNYDVTVRSRGGW